MTRLLLLLTLVLSLSVAACGDDDDDSGGPPLTPSASQNDDSDSADAAKFGAAVNRFCERVKTATQKVSQDPTTLAEVEQGRGGEAVVRSIKAYGTAIGAAIREYEAADAPAQYENFRDESVGTLSKVVGVLNEIVAEIESGNPDGLQDIANSIGNAKVPEAPAELQSKAPACRSLAAG